jgi:hypothetical protein
MLTKEQIEEIRRGDALTTKAERRELCDLALRAVGGEAVAWRYRFRSPMPNGNARRWQITIDLGYTEQELIDDGYEVEPLYTAPAAPANEALAGRLQEIMSTVQNFEGWQGEVFREINAALRGGK